MSWKVKHRYTGKVLRSGEGSLRWADLSEADLRRVKERVAEEYVADQYPECAA